MRSTKHTRHNKLNHLQGVNTTFISLAPKKALKIFIMSNVCTKAKNSFPYKKNWWNDESNRGGDGGWWERIVATRSDKLFCLKKLFQVTHLPKSKSYQNHSLDETPHQHSGVRRFTCLTKSCFPGLKIASNSRLSNGEGGMACNLWRKYHQISF